MRFLFPVLLAIQCACGLAGANLVFDVGGHVEAQLIVHVAFEALPPK